MCRTGLGVGTACGGNAKGKPHRSTAQEKEVPCIVMDYMYMGSEQKEGEEKGMPIIVYKDMTTSRGGTGMVFARVVPNKGKNPYSVKSLVSDLKALGRKDMVLKSDGEPARVAVKEAAKAEMDERVVLEHSPV